MIDFLGGQNRWIIFGLLVLALLLAVYPLPLSWRWWRPEFVLLVVIYWVFVLPNNTSLTLVWCLGLIQDLIEGTPLGQHALGLVIVTYIGIQSYRRVRNYALWQQCGWVFVLVGISQLTSNWVYSMAGGTVSGVYFLYPAITSALLWPLCHFGFESLRHHYRIS